MADQKKLRGKPIVLPNWWMQELRTKYEDAKRSRQTNKVKLAVELTKIAGRRDPWDHKAVQRFLDGTTVTVEMMWAFLDYFPSLAQPVFWAPTREDAERMLDFVRRGDTSPEWKRRYRSLESELLEITKPLLDQTSALSSVDVQKRRAREQDGAGRGRVGRGRA